jgi:hypothetical protein
MPKKRGYKMMTTLFGSFGHQFVKGLSPSGVFGTLGDVVTGFKKCVHVGLFRTYVGELFE